MPVFEYKCDKCGKISEFLEGLGTRADRRCQHCGGKRLARQISVFSPRVKESQSKKCHGCSDFSCPHAGQ
ncbi:MAG: FmdB family zinc ribbon protein [Planctomycetota bacterium]